MKKTNNKVKKESKVDSIVRFLSKHRSNQEGTCLVIQGAWGIGKTYLWKEVEKKIAEEEYKENNKKVVYIDLFGKESYQQILEEIVLKVNEKDNKNSKLFSKFVDNIVKLASNGAINIGWETLFSLLEKKDFENIIVCFDNIERRSDKLLLKDILGLVNLLKEDKSSNVVMILNEDKLDSTKQENKSKEQKNWYKEFKEKVVDCEYEIENNDEIAKIIIKDNLENKNPNIGEKVKEEVEKIIFNYFEKYCKNNLRLLKKVISYINYFNENCFYRLYESDFHQSFIETLNDFYKDLFCCSIQYFEQERDLNFNTKLSNFPYFKKYLCNLLELDEQDLDRVCNSFEENVKEPIIRNSVLGSNIYGNYLDGNLNDEEFIKGFEILSTTKIDKYSRYRDFSYFKTILDLYKEITGKEFAKKNKIIKDFIEELVLKELNLADDDSTDKDIKELIKNSKEYKKYYDDFKRKYNTNKDIKSFLKKLDIQGSFRSSKIKLYEQFSVDEIIESFKENNEFYKKFFEYFTTSNLQEQEIKNYDLSNNLFQAYKKFLNQKEFKTKKETIIKKLENEKKYLDGGILLKLLNEN